MEQQRLVVGDPFVLRVELERRFGHRLGAFEVVATPKTFPLALTLAREFVRPRFALVGAPDALNRAAIPAERLAAWKAEGVVECWGHRDDMREVYAQAHVVCLPSYHEGLPKALMEAAAAGRPLVAADVPGCREIVRHDETGLLVPAKEVAGLAVALRRLIEEAPLRQRLGRRARQAAVEEFSQELVVERTLAVYRGLLGA